MIIKQTIQTQLEIQEIHAIQSLKEKNQALYSVAYKLDLSIFNSTNEKVNHLLCWDQSELVGYAALTSFQPKELEVTIIAKPNKEVLKKMNETLLEFSRYRKIKEILLINDHKDTFVSAYVQEMNTYNYSFSEYAMTLAIDKFISQPYNNVLELAKPEDVEAIARLEETDEIVLLDPDDLKKTFVLRKKEQVIASIRVENEQDSYGIYGFIIKSDFRNQGLGRKVISQLIQHLLEKQAREIYLEVESTNKVACHLYRSIGFEERTVFDYYSYKLK